MGHRLQADANAPSSPTIMDNPVTNEDPSLLFEWAPPKGEKFLISTFLVGSLILHAVAFYLFRIIYPPAIALLPPPARVNLITPTSEEGRTLLRWIEAEDPALASATVRAPDSRSRALPKLAHVPSYVIEEPKLKELPPFEIPLTAPDAFPAAPARVFGNRTERAWPKIATHVSFSNELSEFGALNFSPPLFSGSNTEPPENIRFRVAVNSHGEIQYCFRINSSGDPALDEQARLWLVRSRFANRPTLNSNSAGEQNLIWGVATVEWGNDVSQPARATPPPSP